MGNWFVVDREDGGLIGPFVWEQEALNAVECLTGAKFVYLPMRFSLVQSRNLGAAMKEKGAYRLPDPPFHRIIPAALVWVGDLIHADGRVHEVTETEIVPRVADQDYDVRIGVLNLMVDRTTDHGEYFFGLDDPVEVTRIREGSSGAREGVEGRAGGVGRAGGDADICRHCGRAIVVRDRVWIDPEATGDDGIWQETCDSHDTFEANHEPEEKKGRWETVRDDRVVLVWKRDTGEEIYVEPGSLIEGGIPIDEDTGVDLEYVETQVWIDGGEG